MLANLTLVTCVLVCGQGIDGPQWQMTPQFSPGQELVYTGTCVEESLAPTVHFQRRYRMENRLFVLGTSNGGWDVAFLSSLHHDHQSEKAQVSAGQSNRPASVRLETAHIDLFGHVKHSAGLSLSPPVDGPPTIETGYILVVPATRVHGRQKWHETEPGRPPRQWRVVGTEIVSNTTCVKVEGEQTSEDWTRPRADSFAWRRIDRIWFAPQAGIVYKVQRIIEQRQPARTQPHFRITVQYELESQLAYPGRLREDRRLDILQCAKWNAEAVKYFEQPAKHSNELELLRRRIESVLQQGGTTPYRQAMRQLHHRIKAVQRGDVVVQTNKAPIQLISVARLGERAPDFLVTDLNTKESIRLNKILGKPVVIIFYNPATVLGNEVVRFIRDLNQEFDEKITVLGMAVTDDVEVACKQHRDMQLTSRLLDGKGLHQTFSVDATPRIILLDRSGIVRHAITGWAPHITQEIRAELQRYLAFVPE